MGQFYDHSTSNRKAKLIRDPRSVETEDLTDSIPARPYLYQTGRVLRSNDTGYDCERPTGYEPVEYLIEFSDGVRLWIPSAYYCGEDGNGKERWERFLRFV